MNEEKAREMALSITAKVRKDIARQTARVRTGIVPNLEKLTRAIQTYRVGRYLTYPDVWTKGKKYRYDYTQVEVNWRDEEWSALVLRISTVKFLWQTEGVFPPATTGYLVRRDGNLVMRDRLLRKDPESGVYLFEGCRPPQEILQIAAAGPFRVEVHKTVVKVLPDNYPMVLHYGEPNRRVRLRYSEQEARVSLKEGRLLSQFALWRMLD